MHCNTVLAKNPANWEILALKASILASNDQHEEAIACFDQAIAINKKVIESFYHRRINDT